MNGGSGLANTAGGYEPGWSSADDTKVKVDDVSLACSGLFDAWTSAPAGNERLPINCLTWYTAYAFCIWDGGFLPSRAEWEYAAAGGSEERQYPWGSTPPGTSSQYAIYNCFYQPNPDGGSRCWGIANIAQVGTATLGGGKWGHLDLAGEIDEWLLDWETDYVDPCVDCTLTTVPNVADQMRWQGGIGWYGNHATSDFEPPQLAADIPASGSLIEGVRCARSP